MKWLKKAEVRENIIQFVALVMLVPLFFINRSEAIAIDAEWIRFYKLLLGVMLFAVMSITVRRFQRIRSIFNKK